MKYKIESLKTEVEEKSRAFRNRWTSEQAQKILEEHGDEIEEEMSKILRDEVSKLKNNK